MDGSFGSRIGQAIANAFIFAIVFTAVVVGLLTFAATRYFAPTPESVAREQERRAVIEQLTPAQRKSLGFE